MRGGKADGIDLSFTSVGADKCRHWLYRHNVRHLVQRLDKVNSQPRMKAGRDSGYC